MGAVPDSAWIALLAAAAGVFAVLETIALANRHEGDTLSEAIRRWLGVTPSRAGRRVSVGLFVAGLLGFVAWFVPHIVAGWGM